MQKFERKITENQMELMLKKLKLYVKQYGEIVNKANPTEEELFELGELELFLIDYYPAMMDLIELINCKIFGKLDENLLEKSTLLLNEKQKLKVFEELYRFSKSIQSN
jgi:hypothetical protein